TMGQEIGVTPLQLVDMVSTIANDGMWVAPRIMAGTVQPRGTPQMITFHSGPQRRVISTLTAAKMKQMMQGVVLHGTGKKAILEGYSSAGKTGTAQKVDPATRTYSRTKYVASFAGFAPINDPSITVAVILDSAVGLHQGGQISAPVFQRVAQQVLEYLHAPHDVDLPPSRQVLLAERQVKEQDIEEGSPDRLGDTFEAADTGSTEVASAGGGANQLDPQLSASPAKPTPNVTTGVVVPAASRKREAPSRAPEQCRPSRGITLPTTTAGGGAT